MAWPHYFTNFSQFVWKSLQVYKTGVLTTTLLSSMEMLDVLWVTHNSREAINRTNINSLSTFFIQFLHLANSESRLRLSSGRNIGWFWFFLCKPWFSTLKLNLWVRRSFKIFLKKSCNILLDISFSELFFTRMPSKLVIFQ